jgi:ParB family chromosome partitioning protein
MIKHSPMSGATAPLEYVPLSSLYLHEMNPRQTTSDDDVAAMADSITINGLLQNLLGFREPGRDKIGIVAGGRRLRGLMHLEENGAQSLDSKVPNMSAIPVQVTEDPFLARAWAGTESATQRPLHPADEIRAYAAMAAQGNSPEMIARTFAQTLRHVKGRLALAHLRTATIEALRRDDITLDVAKALTLARDPDQELEVLTKAIDSGMQEWRVRDELVSRKVRANNYKAVYVGAEAYVAAGGEIREDLFEEETFFDDAALLDKLFTAKLKDMAEAIKAQFGWKWVEICDTAYVPYTAHEKFDHIPKGKGGWKATDRSESGIFVYVDSQGKQTIDGAYRAKDGRTAAGSTEGGSTSTEAPRPKLTQAGAEDLRKIELTALQTAMLGRTEMVLDLFAWQLERGDPGYTGVFAVTLSDSQIEPEQTGAWKIAEALVEGSNTHWPATKGNSAVEEFKAFQAKGKKYRNTVLTQHLIRTVNGSTSNSLGRTLLAPLFGPDIRSIWCPDAATYFSRIDKGSLERIWQELVVDHQPEISTSIDFASMKKGDKVDVLHRLFNDVDYRNTLQLSQEAIQKIENWLPPELEFYSEDAA